MTPSMFNYGLKRLHQYFIFLTGVFIGGIFSEPVCTDFGLRNTIAEVYDIRTNTACSFDGDPYYVGPQRFRYYTFGDMDDGNCYLCARWRSPFRRNYRFTLILPCIQEAGNLHVDYMSFAISTLDTLPSLIRIEAMNDCQSDYLMSPIISNSSLPSNPYGLEWINGSATFPIQRDNQDNMILEIGGCYDDSSIWCMSNFTFIPDREQTSPEITITVEGHKSTTTSTNTHAADHEPTNHKSTSANKENNLTTTWTNTAPADSEQTNRKSTIPDGGYNMTTLTNILDTAVHVTEDAYQNYTFTTSDSKFAESEIGSSIANPKNNNDELPTIWIISGSTFLMGILIVVFIWLSWCFLQRKGRKKKHPQTNSDFLHNQAFSTTHVDEYENVIEPRATTVYARTIDGRISQSTEMPIYDVVKEQQEVND